MEFPKWRSQFEFELNMLDRTSDNNVELGKRLRRAHRDKEGLRQLSEPLLIAVKTYRSCV